MSTTMDAITEWIRTLGSTPTTSDASTEPAGEPETVRSDGAGSSLFQCAECRSVYVATEKTTCAGCGTPVERVASTLETSD